MDVGSHRIVLIDVPKDLRPEDVQAVATDGGDVEEEAPSTERDPPLAVLACPLRLEIPGDLLNQRMRIVVNDQPIGLSDSPFAVLFALVAERIMRGVDSWVSVESLGGQRGETFQPVYKLNKLVRRELPTLFPGDDGIHENGKRRYRLSTRIAEVRVNAAAFLHDSQRRVRELAAQLVEMGARSE